jgi:hypothetical protein
MFRLMDKFVDWWMRRCPHDDDHVAADILSVQCLMVALPTAADVGP